MKPSTTEPTTKTLEQLIDEELCEALDNLKFMPGGVPIRRYQAAAKIRFAGKIIPALKERGLISPDYVAPTLQ